MAIRANSLALRLFLWAAGWTIAIVLATGIVLSSLYRDAVERAFDGRLQVYLRTLVADLAAPEVPDDKLAQGVSEPLFELPLSGWYWQVTQLNSLKPEIRASRSLWDGALALPKGASVSGMLARPKEIARGVIVGPAKEKLRVAARVVRLPGRDAPVLLITAVDEGPALRDLGRFTNALFFSLIALGVMLVLAVFLQVRIGLAPLRKLQEDVAQVRRGGLARLGGVYPKEVAPLANELNALLDHNVEIVERARTHVGNLAHALKTPLAVIANEARDDPTPFARKVVEQASLMGNQINLYLDRARMAARVGVIGRITEVRPVGESIVRALERIYRDKQLAFTVDCSAAARFQGERQDLEEMLGNLLDNASKWAHTAVVLQADALPETFEPPADKTAASSKAAEEGRILPRPQRWLEIKVSDDGPGLTPEQLAAPIARGRRLDETKPGSGLGHSIVADLAHSYGGRMLLSRSPQGGLCATLLLPLSV